MSIYSFFFFLIFRLRTESMGGAWCPKPMISQFSYEYLQIDLGKLVVITMVEIQGRFGNGQVSITLHKDVSNKYHNICFCGRIRMPSVL